MHHSQTLSNQIAARTRYYIGKKKIPGPHRPLSDLRGCLGNFALTKNQRSLVFTQGAPRKHEARAAEYVMFHFPTSFRFFLFTLFALTGFSCQSDPGVTVPDVSDIDISFDVRRFEQALFKLDSQNLSGGLAALEAAYPVFSQLYFGQILGANDPRLTAEERLEYIRGFIQHPSVRKLYDTTQVVFPTMAPYEEDFRSAFRFFHYYFPEEPIPDVTTYISEFSVAAFVYEGNRLGVGLDLFLGNTFPYRSVDPLNPQFSGYLTRTFTPEHLVSKVLQPLVDDLVGPPASDRLLDHMVRNGKKLLLLDRLLPYTPDSILLEVTPAQTEWLFDNERNIWAYFLQEDLLYSSTWQDFRKFVEYSPHSPGMPPEAPGRTGNFTGWRIVERYMERHPETSLRDLLKMTDAQAILDGARYRPR